MTKFISRFAKDESGATAIEYGLIAALVAVALITVLTTMSGQLKATFTKVETELTKANNAK
ncbi:pilus assembly protein Flp/PilA [Brevundimonas sp. UYEF29]|uniref:Flp family type IVb pilin n=1 Tax=Brevundimonas sp. UYEF29 TaxID=3156346 RepID=UPI0033915BD8